MKRPEKIEPLSCVRRDVQAIGRSGGKGRVGVYRACAVSRDAAGAAFVCTMSVQRPPATSHDLNPFDSTQDIDRATSSEMTNSKNNSHEFGETHVINSAGMSVVPSCAPAAGGMQRARSTGSEQQGNPRTRTVADLRAARESRANEALKMKDEQLRILQDQNNQLLGNLDR